MPDSVWLLGVVVVGVIVYFAGYATGNRFGYDEGRKAGFREAQLCSDIERIQRRLADERGDG